MFADNGGQSVLDLPGGLKRCIERVLANGFDSHLEKHMKKIHEQDTIGYQVYGYEQTEGGMNVHFYKKWTSSLEEAMMYLEQAEKSGVCNCDWLIAVEIYRHQS